MTIKKISFVTSRDSVGFQLDGNPVVIPKSHMNYHNIIAVLESGDIEAVRPLLVEVKQAIADSSDGSITFADGKLWFEGEELHNAMVPRIIGLIRDDLSVAPLVNFLRNLLDNPSQRAREELYGFMEVNDLPVTPDGYFIAYKMVRSDFLDIRTGTMDNSPGATPKMKRADVDPDKNRTCSVGLHFAALEYVVNGGYGSRSSGHRLVALKINPRDVVAIPTDYNNSKGRASQYLVLREMDWDSRLPVNTAGFSLFNNEEPADANESAAEASGGEVLTLTPSGAVQSRPGVTLYSDADILRVKRLLAEPDASLTGVSKATGMSRRQVARIRDGQVGAHIRL
jgi:hypothetical protein